MDDLLKAVANLLGTFKDPTQVLLLLVALGESFIIWRFVRWLMERNEKDIEARTLLATTLGQLADAVKRDDHGKP
jgi:hypothetical protein